jgi:Ser/Thr protein kinase RdoA (MazF antagonist)
MKGILDRFEGDKAVILIEENNAELVIEKNELPTGSNVNTVFRMEASNGSYNILSIDTAKTDVDAKKSSDLMAKLRSKSSGSKFRKN